MVLREKVVSLRKSAGKLGFWRWIEWMLAEANLKSRLYRVIATVENWLNTTYTQESIYNESRGNAWASFYASPPHQAANAFMAVLAYLLEQGGEFGDD